MKVIRDGKKKVFRKTCEDCDCEFEYDLKDLQTDYSLMLTSYPGRYERYVVCPCCGKRIHHDYVEHSYVSKFPNIIYTSNTPDWPDCETCPNKPNFKNGKPIFGDTPCNWCVKNQPYCR